MVVAMLLAVGLGGCVSECEKAGRDFSNAHDVSHGPGRGTEVARSSTAMEGKVRAGRVGPGVKRP